MSFLPCFQSNISNNLLKIDSFEVRNGDETNISRHEVPHFLGIECQQTRTGNPNPEELQARQRPFSYDAFIQRRNAVGDTAHGVLPRRFIYQR